MIESPTMLAKYLKYLPFSHTYSRISNVISFAHMMLFQIFTPVQTNTFSDKSLRVLELPPNLSKLMANG